jgi:hypothetical protein
VTISKQKVETKIAMRRGIGMIDRYHCRSWRDTKNYTGAHVVLFLALVLEMLTLKKEEDALCCFLEDIAGITEFVQKLLIFLVASRFDPR